MALLWLGTTQAMAQKDSLAVESLSLEDSITIDSASLSKALAPKALRKKRNWATWRPDTKRAMWLALVLPGAGQIYNRKYWKLPIIYGGFVGCAYAMSWNNQMYQTTHRHIWTSWTMTPTHRATTSSCTWEPK